MEIKNMINALQLQHKKVDHHDLMTVWGEKIAEKYLIQKDGKVVGINKEAKELSPVLDEYPRPQLKRDNYTILNGVWKYAFHNTLSIPKEDEWQGDILVPFSPETALSGVSRQLKPNEYLWYERSINLEKVPVGKRLILHFGAVDERCRVFVNGSKVGDHAGGYQAFQFDISDKIHEGENIISVWVKDVSDTSYHGRGKQKLQNSGMFYTAQSGIWQTVWMEWVPVNYIKEVRLTPLYDKDSVRIEIFQMCGKDQKEIIEDCRIQILDEGQQVANIEMKNAIKADESGVKYLATTVMIPDKKSWSPVSPFLYDVEICLGEDTISSYFGMRLFSIEKGIHGNNCICLNHVPYFQNGILDQGYWPESLMTPPADEAMLADIRAAKRFGFNMIRKHCKIEPMRWYYHCDKEGMIVWQDMINGGETYNMLFSSYIPTCFTELRKIRDDFYKKKLFPSRVDKKGRIEWKRDCKNTVQQLYNCPCIGTWVLFNEGWGQFDAEQNTEFVKKYDASRLIDSASGWFDQKCGDIKSTHIYFFDIKMETHKRAFALSEYGGYSIPIEQHTYSENVFGYKQYQDRDEFVRDFKILKSKVLDLKQKGMSAAVYTQLTDIEEEVNGLLTYDRKVKKI